MSVVIKLEENQHIFLEKVIVLSPSTSVRPQVTSVRAGVLVRVSCSDI